MHRNGVFLSWDWDWDRDLACMAGWRLRPGLADSRDALHGGGGEFRVSRCGVRIRSVE